MVREFGRRRAAAHTTAARNTGALVAARVVGAVASTAVLAVSAHRMSAEEFGVVASVLAGGFLANALVTFGTDTVVTRAVARGGGSEARTSLVFQLAVSAFLVVLAVAGASAWSWPSAVVVQAIVLVPLSVVTVTGAVLRGEHRMAPVAAAAVVGGLVSLAAVLVAAERVAGPVGALGLGAVATATIQTAAVARSRRLARSLESAPGVASLLRSSAPFAAMVVLAAVGAQGGLLLVEALTDTPTGGYGAALRVVEAGRLVPAAAMAAWFPILAGSDGDGGRTPGGLGYRAWRWGLLALSILGAISVVVLAPVIDRVVFDAQPDGVVLLRVLALGLPLTTVRLIRSTEAIAADRERRVVLSALAGTAVLLVGGAAAAGPWGAVGVAGAQVAGVAVAVGVLATFGGASAAARPTEPAAGRGGV